MNEDTRRALEEMSRRLASWLTEANEAGLISIHRTKLGGLISTLQQIIEYDACLVENSQSVVDEPKPEPIQFTFQEWMRVNDLLNSIINPNVRFQNEHLAMATDALGKCRESAREVQGMFIEKATADCE